jgi:lactate dehydrogenase-like 2-hydroxyacid dehydrogenase
MGTRTPGRRPPPKFRCTVAVGLEAGGLSPEGWARIRATTRRLVVGDRVRRALRDVLPEADCLLLGLGERADRGTLERSPRLRYIGVLGTGYEGIDVAAAAERGVVVCNVPGYATEAVAEITLAAILGELRHVARSLERARAGDLSGDGLDGEELHGKVLGVVGMGRIGRRVAEVAVRGFGARVAYWSRSRRPEAGRAVARFMDLDRLLEQSDVVTIHLPLTEATAGLIDARRLSLLKNGAVVVNFSPMGLIELRPLLRHLRARRFTLALDHADDLTASARRALRALPNCRVYPPIAYRTAQARDARESIFVSNVEAFLRRRSRNRVGVEA